MQTLIGSYPQAGPLIADITAYAMDWPASTLVAKRLRAAVPPEILAATGETGGDDMEPAAKAQMLQQQLTQASQQLQQLNAHAVQVENELKLQNEENKLLKLKQDVEITKAELDARLKSREMDISEETTVLEFKVKERELELQERQLALQEAQVGIKAITQAHSMNESHMDRIEAKMSQDAERGGVGNMPNMPSMPKIGDSTDLGSSLDADLGGKFEQ